MFFILDNHTIEILNLVAVGVIPILVAMLTRSTATSAVKSITMVVLNAITAVTTSVLDDGGFTIYGIVVLLIQNIVWSAGLYYGVLKPVGLAGTNSTPAREVPGFIG